jgi:hypothetical protein
MYRSLIALGAVALLAIASSSQASGDEDAQDFMQLHQVEIR